jgi:hypothetical protein
MKPILEIGLGIIDKLIPDREARDKAKLELLRAEQGGQFREMELQLSAIIAEANSADPWTSRARPSFLYVVYTLLLFSLPMGVMTVCNPEAAALFTDGFRAWLGAIPEEILTLFGVVMTGYVAGRSWEKVKGVAK